MPGFTTAASAITALTASTTETATANGAALGVVSGASALLFILDVTAAATDVDDTLDVTIESSWDGGTTFFDVASFTQVLGNGGAIRHGEKVQTQTAVAGFDLSTGLAAGATRDCWGNVFRAVWTIVDPGAGAASFTFSVHLVQM